MLFALALALLGCHLRESDGIDPVTPGGDDSGVGDDGGGPTDDSGATDDSGTTDPTDMDGDGSHTKASGGDDCDDGDATVHPGAYDRPDDDIDQDCDGADATCDCVVLDVGGTIDETYTSDITARDAIDLTYLIDTTCSMEPGIAGAQDSIEAVVDEISSQFDTATFGLATFDDYPFGIYGSEGTDKPFTLYLQQTDDAKAVSDAFASIALHEGNTFNTASAFEGLYQTLTGSGYDQDCNGLFGVQREVRPFVASSSDPFGGAAGEVYDPTIPGTGTAGGMGFATDRRLKVIVYMTDNYMRDAENGYGTPGGCPGDAGFSDVVSVVGADSFLVGIAANSSFAVPQMQGLANWIESKADLDGDGVNDLLVFEEGVMEEIASDVIDSVEAIRDLYPTSYASVVLEVRSDPLGIVGTITPASYKDVDTDAVGTLDFQVTYDASALTPSKKVRTTNVSFAVVGDGVDIETFDIDVEIAPLH